MVRPSIKSTNNRSSSDRTSLTFSPGLGSEILIPLLNKARLVLVHDLLNLTQFSSIEAKIARQSYRIQPKLGGFLVPVHVHVGRLTGFVTVPVESVRSRPQDRRHGSPLSLALRIRLPLKLLPWPPNVGVERRRDSAVVEIPL